MIPLRPNEKRAKNAILLILIVLIVEIISILSSYLQYNLLLSAQRGDYISEESALGNDSREMIVGIVYIIVFILSGITFIQWFRRAYFNLHGKAPFLSYDEGWAAGSWFVPIINLFRPYQIMKELYVETKNVLERNGISLNSDLSTNHLGLWWTLWIISGILGQIIFRLSRGAETLDQLINLTLAGMIVGLIGIPLALVTIKVVKDYSKAEPLLNDAPDVDDDSVAAKRAEAKKLFS